MVPSPLAIKRFVLLEPPSLADNTADVDRLLKGLKTAHGLEPVRVGLGLVSSVSRILRDSDWRVTAIMGNGPQGWELLGLEKDDTSSKQFGLAVDLGTTTIVTRLLDLRTGQNLGETALTNPQTEIGPDILTRIQAAKGEGLDRLQGLALECINRAAQNLAAKAGMDQKEIIGLAVAGNTTMTHLLLGLDPSHICREPYIPVINRPDPFPAKELGLAVHPKAPVFVFPNIGSYFGGDLIAGLISSGLAESEEISLLVDVGTNAEVVIGNRDWLMGCAGAAGPALEGGVAKMGMPAGPGAIDRVRVNSKTLEPDLTFIPGGDGTVAGICGSGLIDLVAGLFSAGAIDIRAKLIDRDHPRIVSTGDGPAYLILEAAGDQKEILFSQLDLDVLLRSKAAMYTILATLIKQVGLTFEEIDTFYVAGTFGQHIDPGQAITIGMIPDLPRERFKVLGNSSLSGAEAALLSQESRDLAQEVRKRITYLELNVNQEFMNRFSAAKFLPHTDSSLFPSVSLPKPG